MAAPQLGFRFSDIETRLPELSGLFRVHSRLQIGSFQEITPARITVFVALTTLKVFNLHLRIAAPLDNSHDSAGFICPEVVPDNCERGLGFILPHGPGVEDSTVSNYSAGFSTSCVGPVLQQQTVIRDLKPFPFGTPI